MWGLLAMSVLPEVFGIASCGTLVSLVDIEVVTVALSYRLVMACML